MSQFTKNAIIASFYKLLEQKSFEKITVKDIVEDCGINRKTFYYYFADIYDLTEQILRLEITRFLDSLSEDTSLEERILALFELIEKNKKAIRHIHNSSNKDEFEKYLFKVLYDVLISRIKKICFEQNIKLDDALLMCDFYFEAFSGYILKWIGEGMKPDYSDTVKRVCVMLRGTAELMMENLKKYG